MQPVQTKPEVLFLLHTYNMTTISDLGYQDFSEFMIGHAGSTYWRKKNLFKKVEPYLTYLNIHGLKATTSLPSLVPFFATLSINPAHVIKDAIAVLNLMCQRHRLV